MVVDKIRTATSITFGYIWDACAYADIDTG